MKTIEQLKREKYKSKRCYLCKETEDQVNQLMVEGNRYVCDNCLINR